MFLTWIRIYIGPVSALWLEHILEFQVKDPSVEFTDDQGPLSILFFFSMDPWALKRWILHYLLLFSGFDAFWFALFSIEKKKKVVKKWACLKSNPRQRSESGSPNNWAIPLFKQKLYRYEYTVDLNWTWLFCILKHSPLWPLPSSPFHHLLFFNAWGVGPSPLCGWVDSLLRRRAKNLLKFQNLHLLFVHPFC